jgi:hypothetical protein
LNRRRPVIIVSHTKSECRANVKNYEQAIQQSDQEETSSELHQAEDCRSEGEEKAGCESLTQLLKKRKPPEKVAFFCFLPARFISGCDSKRGAIDPMQLYPPPKFARSSKEGRSVLCWLAKPWRNFKNQFGYLFTEDDFSREVM